MSEALEDCLKGHDMFDTSEGRAHRLLVLGRLNELMKRWVTQVSLEKVPARPPTHLHAHATQEHIQLVYLRLQAMGGPTCSFIAL